jgi:hypothetical protein
MLVTGWLHCVGVVLKTADVDRWSVDAKVDRLMIVVRANSHRNINTQTHQHVNPHQSSEHEPINACTPHPLINDATIQTIDQRKKQTARLHVQLSACLLSTKHTNKKEDVAYLLNDALAISLSNSGEAFPDFSEVASLTRFSSGVYLRLRNKKCVCDENKIQYRSAEQIRTYLSCFVIA